LDPVGAARLFNFDQLGTCAISENGNNAAEKYNNWDGEERLC
jgi:hypothetical protein